MTALLDVRAVSVAFGLRGDFPWKRLPGYILAQLIGAVLACLFLLAVFGNGENLGAALPGADTPTGRRC